MLPSPGTSLCLSGRGKRTRRNSPSLGFIPNIQESLDATFHEGEPLNDYKQRRESLQIPMANILQELKSPGENTHSTDQKKELHEAIMCALDGRKTPRFAKRQKHKRHMDIESLRSSLVDQVRQNEEQRLQLLMARNKKMLNDMNSNKQTQPRHARNLTDYSLKRREPPKDIQRFVDVERSKTFAGYSRSKLDIYSREKSKHGKTGSKGQKDLVTKGLPRMTSQENVNKLAAVPPAGGKKDYLIPPPKAHSVQKAVKPKSIKTNEQQINTNSASKMKHKTTQRDDQKPSEDKTISTSKAVNDRLPEQTRDKSKLQNAEIKKTQIKRTNVKESDGKNPSPKKITTTAIVHEFIKHALGVKGGPPESSFSRETTLSLAGSRPGTRHGASSTPLPWTQGSSDTLLKGDIPGDKVHNVPGLVNRPFKQSCEDTLWMISPTPEYVLKSLIGIWLRPFLSDDSNENYVENLEKREKYAEAQRSKLLWIRAYMQRLAAMV